MNFYLFVKRWGGVLFSECFALSYKERVTLKGSLHDMPLGSFVILLLVHATVTSMCGCQHRYTLLMDLYYATNGAGWTNTAGWMLAPPNCANDWYGVSCTGTDVYRVGLDSNHLVGTLPSSWWNMTGLLDLQLQRNTISGTLPDAWTTLVNLQILAIYQNNLVGPLPAWPGMVGIKNLQLYYNSLVGTLPSSWSVMTQVTMMYLHYNQLNGTLPPSWSSWTVVTDLEVHGNSLTGVLPISWSTMGGLTQVLVADNRLTGTLPPSWTHMRALINAYMQGNSFSGALPSAWGNMSNLAVLYLFTNQLSGSLPISWTGLSKMADLELQQNQLTGHMPASWSSTAFPLLTKLVLDSNCMTGPVPTTSPLLRIPGGLSVCNTNIRSGSVNVSMCAGSAWPSYCNILASQSPNMTFSQSESPGQPKVEP